MSVLSNKIPSTPSIVIEDSDIEDVLAEFGGNSKETIRALLYDLAVLAEDRDTSVSFGYVRGRLYSSSSASPSSTEAKLVNK